MATWTPAQDSEIRALRTRVAALERILASGSNSGKKLADDNILTPLKPTPVKR